MTTRTTKKQLTKESIIKAIESGATTMTAVVKALGYKSVCGGTTKRIRELVPDIDQRLGGGKGKAKPAAKSKKSKTLKADPEAERLCPYRRGKYRFIWLLLYRHRKDGISREKILDKMEQAGVSDRKTGYYAVTVVASPTESGTAHRSANRAADSYHCEKVGSNIRLVMR